MILIKQEPELEVETSMDYREGYGRGWFLVKWKDYPASKNSWKLIEGLEHGERCYRHSGRIT